MRFLNFIVSLLLLTGAAFAQASKPQPLLPNQFAGWHMQGQPQDSKDPGVADPVNAAVLKEYGFTALESAVYMRDDGRKLTLKAASFTDATGAFGAFTYYRIPQMLSEQIGNDAASLNERVLFYRGNILIDAVFSKLSAMSAAELRELAGGLPLPAGTSVNLPSLPAYLPKQSYSKNTLRYVIGPDALSKQEPPLPADIVDFNAGAEVVLAKYGAANGQGTLMLIAYPTPQIATEHLKRIETAQSTTAGGVALGPMASKRSGPIVAVAAGPFSQSEAQSLLSSVNYDADVTWNQNTYVDKKNNMANLLVNVIWLCAIIIGLMLVAGLAFGGLRIFLRRLLPERIFARPEEVDFISLNLSEDTPETANRGVSSSIKAL
jgi:hypothetical protein